MLASRRRSAQQAFRFPPGHGGRRAGAGRKPTGAGARVSHAERAPITRHLAAHVTLRVRPDLPFLRSGRCFFPLARAFGAASERFGFRLCEFSVQGNHLHLVVEANDRRALARGMQGLQIRAAKALNRRLVRRGSVFADRYHARVLTTPRETRLALRYVLLNQRKHASARADGGRRSRSWVDPFSSAPHFAGFTIPVRHLRAQAICGPLTARPASALLRFLWRRAGGPLAPDEPKPPAAARAMSA